MTLVWYVIAELHQWIQLNIVIETVFKIVRLCMSTLKKDRYRKVCSNTCTRQQASSSEVF